MVGGADSDFNAIILLYGGYSSGAERLSVAQDVVGSIPTSRPKYKYSFYSQQFLDSA